jgi:hypothetical protein
VNVHGDLREGVSCNGGALAPPRLAVKTAPAGRWIEPDQKLATKLS